MLCQEIYKDFFTILSHFMFLGCFLCKKRKKSAVFSAPFVKFFS